MLKTTDTNKTDKMGDTARTISRTSQKSARTAMDYARGAQEVNTEILRRTSQAWIEGFRYQARLSQGMAKVFFGQRGNAFKSMPPVELSGQEQSGSEVIEPATNGAQKVTEPAAKDVQKDIEKAKKAKKLAKEKQKAAKQRAEKQKAEKQKAEKQKAEKQKAEKQRAEKQEAEKVARETRKAEVAAEETQEATETAAKSAQKSAEPAAKDAQKNTGTAAFPIEAYDEMNVGEVSERLDSLSEAELKSVTKYEKDNKDRGTLRKEMKQKIEATS